MQISVNLHCVSDLWCDSVELCSLHPPGCLEIPSSVSVCGSLTVSWLTILWLCGVGVVANGGTSLTACSSQSTSTLDIAGSSGLPLPEWTSTRSLCVVVGWGGAISLLSLVVSNHQNLPNSCDEEEEDGNDGNRKNRSVESAGKTQVGEVSRILAAAEAKSILAVAGTLAVRWAVTKRRLDIAAAAVGTVASEPSDGSKCTDEAYIEEDSKEAEKHVPTEAEDEEDAENGVECCCASQALNCLPLCRNW